jgi:hypothetical protein
MVQENATVWKLLIAVSPYFDEVIEPHFHFVTSYVRALHTPIGVFFNFHFHVAPGKNFKYSKHSSQWRNVFFYPWRMGKKPPWPIARCYPVMRLTNQPSKMEFLETQPSCKHTWSVNATSRMSEGTSHQSPFLTLTIGSCKVFFSLSKWHSNAYT